MLSKEHPSKHLLILKTSSTRLHRKNFTSSKTSWRRLGRRKIVPLKTSWRRLEDMSWILVFKTSWRHVLKTSWRHILKTSWRHAFRMSWRHVLKTSWRYFRDKQNTYWGYLYTYLGITNLNVYQTSLYFTNLYPIILRRIQNPLIRTQKIHYSPILELKQHLYLKNCNLCDDWFVVVKSNEFKFDTAEKVR